MQQVVSDWSFMWLCGNFMRACVKSHRKCIFKRMIETSQIEKMSTSERLQAMEQCGRLFAATMRKFLRQSGTVRYCGIEKHEQSRDKQSSLRSTSCARDSVNECRHLR